MNNPLSPNSVVFKLLVGVGLPIAIAFSGWLIARSIETSKADAEWVRIALEILTSDKPEKAREKGGIPSGKHLALNSWAIRLIKAKSPEKFTDNEQKALLDDGIENVAFPRMISGVAYLGGAVLGISPGVKIKAHAENPAQERMSTGMARQLRGVGKKTEGATAP
jgi:hypothetical protein